MMGDTGDRVRCNLRRLSLFDSFGFWSGFNERELRFVFRCAIGLLYCLALRLIKALVERSY